MNKSTALMALGAFILVSPLLLLKVRNIGIEREIQNQFDQSIKASDYRFIALKGYTPIFPGVPSGGSDKKVLKYGFKFIGASDGYVIKFPDILVKPSPYNFAYGYNTKLILFLNNKKL